MYIYIYIYISYFTCHFNMCVASPTLPGQARAERRRRLAEVLQKQQELGVARCEFVHCQCVFVYCQVRMFVYCQCEGVYCQVRMCVLPGAYCVYFQGFGVDQPLGGGGESAPGGEGGGTKASETVLIFFGASVGHRGRITARGICTRRHFLSLRGSRCTVVAPRRC